MTVACFGRAGVAWRDACRQSQAVFLKWRWWLAICCVIPFWGTMFGQAVANSLNEATERYRPLIIKEIGVALNGVRELRASISREPSPPTRRSRAVRAPSPARLTIGSISTGPGN